jgi:hypothetical protein
MLLRKIEEARPPIESKYIENRNTRSEDWLGTMRLVDNHRLGMYPTQYILRHSSTRPQPPNCFPCWTDRPAPKIESEPIDLM